MLLDGPLLQIGSKVEKLVILFHGFGASGNDLIQITHAWKNALDNVLYVAPNGLAPRYDDYFVEDSFKWFDIGPIENIQTHIIMDGLIGIRQTMLNYVDAMVSKYNLTYNDLVLMGFSQGAMIAFDLLTHHKDISFAMGYGGAYIPMEDSVECHGKRALIVHGIDDEIVDYKYAEDTYKGLKSLGIHAELVTCHDLGHSINPHGLDAGAKFLQTCYHIKKSL